MEIQKIITFFKGLPNSTTTVINAENSMANSVYFEAFKCNSTGDTVADLCRNWDRNGSWVGSVSRYQVHSKMNDILFDYLDGGETKFYGITENFYNNDNKKGCPICGEYGKWTKCGKEVKHSKKNCPYNKCFGWEDGKKAKYILSLMKLNIANQLVRGSNKHYADLKKIKTERAAREILFNTYEEKLGKIETELALFHRIMPQDTIVKRKEEHQNMLLEIKEKNKESIELIKSVEPIMA